MKPIQEFTEQDGILINNEQESQEIREMLHGMGLKWYHKAAYIDWEPMSMPFVLYPKQGINSYIEDAKNNNITLHPASDYIIKPGDEVEGLWDDMWMNNENYIGKTLNGIYITEDKSGYIYKREAIRKPPTQKSKAIAEIKKIAEENGIEVKIL